MDIKDIRLKKGMSKEEVNELISEWLLFEDEVYMGSKYGHNWECKCGNVIIGISWTNIRGRNAAIRCNDCKRKELMYRHKKEVESINGYKYINSYFSNEYLPNGKIVPYRSSFVEVMHDYCNSIYVIKTNNFITDGQRCSKCCGSYEKSFAYHIEVELGESLEKYWDFEKNTLNPYHISMHYNGKVWIKCQEKDYHGSYEVSCDNFIKGNRCGYCKPSGKYPKVHQKDSFGQWLKDEGLFHLWSSKNNIDPFSIACASNRKIWMLCDKHDYHNDYGGYEIFCGDFKSGKRCPYCKGIKVHPYDSFGYHNLDKAMSWHPDNDISPFKVSRCNGKKYKFICYECDTEWCANIYSVTYRSWCPGCNKSKGESAIESYLLKNKIKYFEQKEYNGLVGTGGGKLRYDFYINEYNLLIEYQGEFHDGKADMQTEENLLYQQEHDRRKREYADKNNIKLLEIWYWDFDNIEEILNKELISSNKLI